MNKEEILIGIARRLKLARENMDNGLGISQRELSVMSGVTKSSVSAYENAETDPSVTNLMALAQTLGVTEGWIMNGSNYIDVGPDPEKAKLVQAHLDYLNHLEEQRNDLQSKKA